MQTFVKLVSLQNIFYKYILLCKRTTRSATSCTNLACFGDIVHLNTSNAVEFKRL